MFFWAVILKPRWVLFAAEILPHVDSKPACSKWLWNFADRMQCILYSHSGAENLHDTRNLCKKKYMWKNYKLKKQFARLTKHHYPCHCMQNSVMQQLLYVWDWLWKQLPSCFSNQLISIYAFIERKNNNIPFNKNGSILVIVKYAATHSDPFSVLIQY